MQIRKIVVLLTAALSLALFAVFSFHVATRWPDPVHLDTSRLPSVGNARAPVQIVVIEDFFCGHCKSFAEVVFPKIESKYIDAGKARSTLVLVAFSPASRPLANAALAVYHQSKGIFLSYVSKLFELVGREEINRKTLLSLAEEVGGIDLEKLADAIDANLYYPELEENYRWGRSVMGKRFGTPALYVNGILTPASSFSLIEERVQYFLQRGP